MPVGFTYNGVHSDTYNITAEVTTRSITPPLTARTLSVPALPGEWYQRTDMGPRWIPVKIAFVDDTVEDLWTLARNIAGWLSPVNGPQALVFDNSPGITYYGVLDDAGSGGSGSQATDVTQLATLGEAQILFRCPDPFGYETQTDAIFTNDAVAPNVSGTYKTYPIFDVTFTGAAVNPKITNTTTGEFVLLNHTFAAGDTMMVDCRKKLIQINGTDSNSELDLSSSPLFISLQPGQNSLAITPAGVTTATVYWMPRWQ